MKRLISPRCRRVLSSTTMAACLVAIFIPMFASFAQAINPVPFVNQPPGARYSSAWWAGFHADSEWHRICLRLCGALERERAGDALCQ